MGPTPASPGFSLEVQQNKLRGSSLPQTKKEASYKYGLQIVKTMAFLRDRKTLKYDIQQAIALFIFGLCTAGLILIAIYRP